jgi:hypothetical protein
MLMKWTLIAFGIAAIALFVLSKVLGWVERTLRWTVLIPFALAVVLLVLALTGTAPP